MESCEGHYCGKCRGMLKSLLGVLILINAFVWPQWHGTDGWLAFFGVLLVFGGVAKSFSPSCGCCKGEAMMPAKKGKK